MKECPPRASKCAPPEYLATLIPLGGVIINVCFGNDNAHQVASSFDEKAFLDPLLAAIRGIGADTVGGRFLLFFAPFGSLAVNTAAEAEAAVIPVFCASHHRVVLR